jgi:hypothetical protein
MLTALIYSAFPASSSQGATSSELLQKGLAAYQSQHYAEAKDVFQKMLDQGEVTPGVLNNLALAAYQLDQKPYALALWRRALFIDPRFRPAHAGRDFLETKMQIRPLEHDGLSWWIRRLLEGISLTELLCLNAIVLSGLGTLWIRYWGRRRIALEDASVLPQFPTLAVMVLFLFLISLTFVVYKGKETFSERATVIGSKVSGRSLPTDEGVSLFELSGGNEVVVRRQQDNWVQVQNSDGASGWVKASEIFLTTAM